MNEPACIKRLDDTVVNRIAAGEVIQRPANALKELIENSIDAKANNIQVSVKESGLKLLQIIDNGTGIRQEDLAIVCERFTTSKLEKFEDLTTINTYGFRGEALASISHVAHLTIQSKTAVQDCAYKASYIDSKLKGLPKPCAGNQGTIITVEDLFYNMSTRKKALRNPTDEFRKIADVVGKYAIHNAAISFNLKKYGDSASIKTPINSNHIDNIQIIYGDTIAKELIKIEYTDTNFNFNLKGCITNVNYSNKRGVFILFINHRLVESTTMKKGIDQVYGTYLPKGAFPFLYLSLEIDSKNVDVNVHPTKHEVHFLHEEQIIEKVGAVIESKLLGSNNSRVFYTQSKLPRINVDRNNLVDDTNKQNSKAIQEKDMVRTCFSDQKLDKFLHPVVGSEAMLNMTKQSSNTERKKSELSSILAFRQAIEDNCHFALKELFSEHVFVGCVSVDRALIQHNTKLYLCNTKKITRELFYQLIMYNLSNFGTITFSKTLSVYQLILIALDLPACEYTLTEIPKEEQAQRWTELLIKYAHILREYFSIEINSEGELVTIPLLIENHTPEIAGLPMFILRLINSVNWNEEIDCMYGIAFETAIYYADIDEENIIENSNWKWITEHVLYPTIKKHFIPSTHFTENGSILQIADLPNLYKVFERC